MSTGWIAFGVLAAMALFAVWQLLLGGERVGGMRCRAIIGEQRSRARFVVKRSAEAVGVPVVEFQSRVTLRLNSVTLNDSEAVRLAELLEEAAARVRAP
jgi:hypothetical protein